MNSSGLSIKNQRTFATSLLLFVLVSLLLTSILAIINPSKSSALSGSEFHAGRIADDGIFFNGNTYSTENIQAFLNAKVPTCDTNGSEIYSGSTTRAQYGASKGYPAPYTCLKNYSQNTPTMNGENGLCNSLGGGQRNTAQIIHDVGVACGVNPAVLLVLLQKEQSLITDAWPWPTQYQKATGFGCPDTAPCDPQYAGFFYQVYNAARQFKKYARDSGNYGYRAYRNNSILYNPSSSCGSSNVYIENQATAGLYIYTPYQPNQAALNDLYGTGDSCSAYGNRNFWRMYNDWFGPSISDSLYFAVIKGPDSPALYLQTPAGKYYIPSGELMQEWGLDKLAVREVDQSYIDNLPTNGWLTRLLSDQWGNLFLVEGGKLHYIRDASYLPLWGIPRNEAVISTGLAYSMPGTSWAGRFVQDEAQPNGSIWLMDNGQKRLVSTNMLYGWRYTADQLTTVSATYLDGLTTGTSVTAYASDGATSYVVDSGQKLSFANADVQNAFYGAQTPLTYSTATLAFLPSTSGSQFIVDSSNGQWFMLEAGKKHYISNGDFATLWGKVASRSPTPLSPLFLANLPANGNLTYVVQSGSPATYWLINGNGTKHQITTSEAMDAWIPAGVTPPTYSAQSLNLLSRGSDATTSVTVPGSPYTYAMEGGTRHYLMTAGARNAWGGTVMSASPQLVYNLPEGVYWTYLVKNNSGQGYLLMNNVLYPIDSNFYDVWGVTADTPVASNQRLSQYTTSGTTLKAFVTINGTSYIMTPSGKRPTGQYADAYKLSSLGAATLPVDYFETTSRASYLATSTVSPNSQIWLVTDGKKIALNFTQAVSYGYLSRDIQPTQLSLSTLNLIPNDTRQASLLIQQQGSGIKLLSFGSALGFPDGDTLVSYVGVANPILVVSDSIFNSFGLSGSASRIIRDDFGNLFWVEGGSKRYILNGTILSHYPAVPQKYLEGTTMYLIPSGSNAQ